MAGLIRSTGATHVLNAVDPRFVMPIFEGTIEAGATYLDMAMSLSRPHPEEPYAQPGVKLGDEQFAARRKRGRSGGCSRSWGSGWSRDCPTCSPGTLQDHLFDAMDEAGVRDGADLVVAGHEFAPGF